MVRLQAPPVEGAANEALVKFLSKRLGLRPADITITAGERSRDKVLEIRGASREDIERSLFP